MTGITKLEASILWGNGFKLKDKEGSIYSILSVSNSNMTVSCDDRDKYSSPITISFDAIGKICFIICHSLDKLTQPIMHEGKEIVPIVELAKLSMPELDWKLKEGKCIACGEGITEPRKHEFYFEENSFYAYWSERHGRYTKVPNQTYLYFIMDSLHFDRFNWQERGLTEPK